MTGWIIAALVLLAAVAVCLNFQHLVKAARDRLDDFLRGDQERAARRRRVFDVLHRVSDAILAGEPDSTLHRLIETGEITRRRAATGGGAQVQIESVDASGAVPVALSSR